MAVLDSAFGASNNPASTGSGSDEGSGSGTGGQGVTLRISGAAIGFDADSPLIEAVDLQVAAGEIVCIIGRSGTGKTTLLRTVAGLVPPLAGDVVVCDAKAPARPSKGEVGLIPQRLGLVQHGTVGYNVIMGALPRAPFWQTLLSLPSRELRDAARQAIEAVGLAGLALESVNRLSGGQQRRVAIARSMVQQPRLLLADECLGELDAETAIEIIALLRSMADESGIGMIVVDHNPVRAATFCDRLLQLRAGRLQPVDATEMRRESGATAGLPQFGGGVA